MYWAQAMSEQTADLALAEKFSGIAEALAQNEAAIIAELEAAQGQAVDMGGYYNPDEELVAKAMRPSATLNGIINAF